VVLIQLSVWINRRTRTPIKQWFPSKKNNKTMTGLAPKPTTKSSGVGESHSTHSSCLLNKRKGSCRPNLSPRLVASGLLHAQPLSSSLASAFGIRPRHRIGFSLCFIFFVQKIILPFYAARNHGGKWSAMTPFDPISFRSLQKDPNALSFSHDTLVH
jgi:hypothetical protein